jgi:hypothetical protein
VTVPAVLGDRLSPGSGDALLWLLQIGGAIVFVGAVGFAAWNVWLAWRSDRGWGGRIWSVLMLLATLTVLLVASAYGLLGMTVHY